MSEVDVTGMIIAAERRKQLRCLAEMAEFGHLEAQTIGDLELVTLYAALSLRLRERLVINQQQLTTATRELTNTAEDEPLQL